MLITPNRNGVVDVFLNAGCDRSARIEQQAGGKANTFSSRYYSWIYD